MSGTQRGAFMGIPATGRFVEVRGVSILTIENGLIARGTNIWDTAGLLRALHLLPEL
jgi:predicted ester cyclase